MRRALLVAGLACVGVLLAPVIFVMAVRVFVREAMKPKPAPRMCPYCRKPFRAERRILHKAGGSWRHEPFDEPHDLWECGECGLAEIEPAAAWKT